MPRLTKGGRLEHTPEERELIRIGIGAAGGTVVIAKALGFASAESVGAWYRLGRLVPAEKARQFVAMTNGTITLQQIRPDLFGGLTTSELGYTPRRAA